MSGPMGSRVLESQGVRDQPPVSYQSGGWSNIANINQDHVVRLYLPPLGSVFSEESVGVFPILTISDLPLMLAELMGNVR